MPATASDAELIAKVLAHDDQEAFGELVLRYQSSIRIWLRRMTRGDEARADDLAQETFVKAYRKLKQFDGRARFSAWLFTIAHNEFRMSCRYRRVEVEFVSDLHDSEDPREVESADLRSELAKALLLLPDGQRAAITLCYQQGLTHEEAAQALGCPLGTLKTNILRAKETLRHYFTTARVQNLT
jgi:RNA polymerase sigma-70 factor (ECF subfamily)